MVNRMLKNCTSSLLGFGGMRFPLLGKSIDEKRSEELLDYAFSKGVTYFDTAYMYHDGESEIFMGKALKRYDRQSYTLADKMPSWLLCEHSEKGAQKLFDEQLKRTGAEYFDYYLCHSLNKNFWHEDYVKYLYDFLLKKKEQGYIKRLGFSFHDDVATLKQIVQFCDWDFAQIQLNYYDYSAQDAEGQYNVLAEKNIPVIIMEPVRGGALADLGKDANALLKAKRPNASVASWAIRYAMSFENVLTVLSGMSDAEQVRDNVETAANFTPLDDSEREILGKALDIFKSSLKVPCTGCRYCMDCPYGVDIPLVFKQYNKFNSSLDKEGLKNAMDELREKGAASCKACRKCCHCPQHIDIPAVLAKIAEQAK